ncbi:hypothetical protein WISP_68110 [Willisornis vidua]|uniref:Reverse transcriptase domain-containing protein n=1 Tax=Willisornis vidua TaxID=1566151 RepID=A0ABQ9DD12_9PASS|nr:hypothetical protein WISP_68110 [Willisornis vidua]
MRAKVVIEEEPPPLVLLDTLVSFKLGQGGKYRLSKSPFKEARQFIFHEHLNMNSVKTAVTEILWPKGCNIAAELKVLNIAQVKCLYTTAHSRGNKQKELEAIAQQESYDIVAFMETLYNDCVTGVQRMVRSISEGTEEEDQIVGWVSTLRECFDCVELKDSDDKVDAYGPSQQGFRKDRSCLINLIFYNQVTHLVNERQAVDVLYLDLSKVFDNVFHNILLREADGLQFGQAGYWMSPDKMHEYQVVLLKQANVKLKTTIALNTAVFLEFVPEHQEALQHACLLTIEQVDSSREDNTPIEDPDSELFTDQSSFVWRMEI